MVLAGLAPDDSGCTLDANDDQSVTLADALWIRKDLAGLVEPLVAVDS